MWRLDPCLKVHSLAAEVVKPRGRETRKPGGPAPAEQTTKDHTRAILFPSQEARRYFKYFSKLLIAHSDAHLINNERVVRDLRFLPCSYVIKYKTSREWTLLPTH